MPRIVDHEIRRAEFADAVLDVIAEHGVEDTTIRRVAAASGRSPGALTHYFASKEDLLCVALGRLFDNVRTLAEEAAQSDAHPYERVRQALIIMLPLNAVGRVRTRVWCALLGAAITRPSIAELHRGSSRVLSEHIARGLREAQEAGEVRPDIDPDREAVFLLAMVEGVGVRASFDAEAFPAKQLIALVDDRLGQLWARD